MEDGISVASSLWIEAGAMSGGSRNQVEFAEELATFFGPPVFAAQLITVQTPNKTFEGCTFSAKTTTFGVQIWRLSLPTESKSGLSYPGKIIHFTRTKSPVFFKLSVADMDSERALEWNDLASANGVTSATSGSRRYGYY